MSEHSCQTETELQPVEANADVVPQTASSWVVSLCFWFTLMMAAAMYGAVALAPKFSVWNQVRIEYRDNVQQLIALEDDVDYLERVEHALQTDPDFVQRLSGVPDRASRPGEELIPVSGKLLFGNDTVQDRIASKTSAESPYHEAIMCLASHNRLRLGLLTFSAGLTIFAFTFLNDAGGSFIFTVGRCFKAIALIPAARYFTTAPAVVQPPAADTEVEVTQTPQLN